MLAFDFAKDGFVYCGHRIADEAAFQFISDVLQQKKAWNCRVPMTKDQKVFFPITIPLWGFAEATHVHLNQHLNWVFHYVDGRIIGGACYTVQDKLQFSKPGSVVNFHGPVRWFFKHSFKGKHELAHHHKFVVDMTWMAVFGWCVLSFLVSTVFYVSLYTCYLRPRLAKKFLKSD